MQMCLFNSLDSSLPQKVSHTLTHWCSLKRSCMGSARTSYLIAYNLAQLLGWSTALCQTLLALARVGSARGVYAAAGPTVRACTARLLVELVFRAYLKP